MRLAYMQSLFQQPLAKLDLVSAGSVSNTITSSANAIHVSISDRLAYLFQGVAVIIAAYAIAFSYSWAITLITSSSILFICVVYSFMAPITLKAMANVDKADEKHASVAAETFASIRTVFSLGADRPLSDKYYGLVAESERLTLRFAPIFSLQLPPAFFAMYAAFALAFWAGLKLYNEGSIPNVNSVIIAFFSILIIVSILGKCNVCGLGSGDYNNTASVTPRLALPYCC